MKIEIKEDDTINSIYEKIPDGFFAKKQLKSTFDSLLEKDEDGMFVLPKLTKVIEDAKDGMYMLPKPTPRPSNGSPLGPSFKPYKGHPDWFYALLSILLVASFVFSCVDWHRFL